MFCAPWPWLWRKRRPRPSRLIGGRALRSDSIDIGVAVEAQDGIMVPVIRNADKTSLADLTSRYTELVDLARRRRVTSEMTSGGIASVSNFGTFGLDWGTPIPLPDQTLLLGLGAGKKAPSWSEEKQQFVPTTQAELTLSFDHRSLDGGGAGRLLQRVVELLEPENSSARRELWGAHAPRVPFAAPRRELSARR